MAVTDDKKPSSTPPSEPAPAAAAEERPPEAAPAPTGPGQPPPLFTVPLYVGGLVFIYLGERVFEATSAARWVFTVAGLLAVLGATIVRFAPRYRVGGERRDMERLLAVLSVLGIVALGVYLLTTEWGMDRLGLASAELETQERVKGALTIGWVGLLLVSVVPMLFAEAALYPMRRAPLPEARRVRVAAASGLALVLAALYGGLLVYASSGADVEVDYSYFKTSRPSDSTRRMAESLSDPIKVMAFFPDVNEVRTEVEHYLRDLGRNNPKLEIEIQDRLLVPKLARELRATQDGVIILTKDKTTSETLTIGTDMAQARPKLKTLDRDFQERLLKLVRARRTAYLSVGHGELNEPATGGTPEDGRAASIVRTLLQKQNYLVKDLGLSQGLGNEVPEDADIVIVLGPSEPFAGEEIAALGRYADRGGKLLMALDPDALSPRDLEMDQATPSEIGPEDHAAADPHARPVTSVAPAGSARIPAKPVQSAKPPVAKPPAPITSGKPATAGKPKPPVGSAKAPLKSADGSKPKPVASAKPLDTPEQPKPAALPDTPAARTLSQLAAIAGVSMEGGVLANDKEHLRRRFNDSDRTLLITNSFSSHAAVSTLSRNSPRAAVVTFGAGGLERAAGATQKVDFAVRSRPATFSDLNRNYTFDEGSERRATFNLAAAVSQPAKYPRAKPPEPPKPEPKPDKPGEKKDAKKDDNKKPPPDETRVFVIADADAFSDLVMSNVVANQVLLLDAVRWLGGEESFAGEVTSEEDVRIEHTKQKDLVWFYATIFGAPALVLGLGLFYVRRTRRTRPRGEQR